MAEVNGVVLLVLILLALTTVVGFALFATVEWGGIEVLGIQTIRLVTRRDGTYLVPNGDGTYRVERDGDEKESFRKGRGRKERMTTNVTQSQTIYVPEKASALVAFAEDDDVPFRECYEAEDCRPLLLTRNKDVIWWMNKAYQDINSESKEELHKRFEGKDRFKQTKLVQENPLTLEIDGVENVLGTSEFPLYYGYVLALLAYKWDDRPLPQVREDEDYATGSDPSSS